MGVFSANFNQAWAKTLVTEVDNRQIEMGDIISVRVIADFQSYAASPDFEALKDQFDVLGSQRSSNMQIINGQYSSTTEWLAQMTPKQTGELRIPSFEVEGARSNPLAIRVTQAKAYGTQNQITFIEAELNKTSAYVQEEVIYNLRFFHLGRLVDGSIRPPQFGDSLVKQLKNQQTYQKKINGQIYEVFEWSYAFYPQQSGELVIAPQDFTGRLQLGSQLRAIHDNSEKLTLQVLQKPSSFPAQANWLPAKNISLSETWQTANSQQNELHVGDSLTRTIKLNALGQLGSQLPALAFENQTGLQIYPDQPQTHEQAALDGYRSEKLFKMAIIPTQAGTLTLSAITLNWWNTQTQTLETAQLPAKTLQVLPALNNPSLPAPSPASNMPNALPDTLVPHETHVANAPPFSNTMQLALSGLVVLLLGAWIWQWQQTRKLKKQLSQLALAPINVDAQISPTPTNHSQCDANQTPADFYRWVNQYLQNQSGLQNNPELTKLLKPLKAHLFHQQALPDGLLIKICDLINQPQTAEKAQQKPQLQALYPQK
ncbi:hypothetical protein THMIRHAT_00890 [Thiosulfativibrio zosterae]|uniref:Protein BatD n=1 Tax=Thiosulfativibrio zosterae TaxID=2675053 RepID=A0A6F8PJR5_9GAMM|nr:hypothetical protein THMIRHAT_00890 [Thiosulfativibrio zosterae]